MSISSCKTAIVTGASRGLGRQIALYLATQNINIVVNYAASRAEAEETLAALTAKAHGVESEPCDISSTFTEVDGGVRLDIDFVFSCEAESLIFQLGLR